MNGLILAFSHFDTGGLQTLMVRMAKWCQSHNIDCLLLYKNSDKNMRDICRNENISSIESFTMNAINKNIKKMKDRTKELTIITFELPEFLYIESILAKVKDNSTIKHFLYNVSVSGMIWGKNFRGILGRLIYKYCRKQTLKYFENNQVIFMDDETCFSALCYYEIKCVKSEPYVYLLPMFISESIINDRNHFHHKQILTVARADFPYKGYIIGLLDDFKDLCMEYKDLILKIISFGPNYEDIIKKISDCPVEIQEKIELINGLSLDKIREELKRSYVYIGMGTTVLDAADEGIPTIVTWHSTMENICTGFFCENPRIIGKAGVGIGGKDLLEKLLSIDRESYYMLCERTYSEFRKNYDINTIMPKMLARKINNTNVKMNFFEMGLFFLIFGMRKFRRKILNI